MRCRPYLFAGLWLSACALPHLEQREQATADSDQSGASPESGAAGKPRVGNVAGRSQGGASGAGANDGGEAGVGAGSEAGHSGDAGASGGPYTAEGGAAGRGSGGASGGAAGRAGASDGGASGGAAGRAGASGGGASGGGASGSAGGSGCTKKNECGGCTVLDGAVGDICTGCGKLACNGFNALMCQASCSAPKAACNTTSNQCVACLTDPDCPVATPVCSANACLVCKPSSTGCSGTTPTSCNATGTVLTKGTVQSGTCGAICNPGVLRCNNLVGQKCTADGTTYASSGSNTRCGCTDSGGRFKFISDTQVKDANTGLVWDFPEHTANNYAGASGICTAKGMRLPTQGELEGLLLATTPAAACSQQLYLAIDSVAFPGIVATTRYWTGDAEGGFPGYYYVVYFFGPSSQGSSSGYGTTDRTATDMVAFQCVQG